MSNNFDSNSRFNYRAKRKKTNLLLNSLIIIVFLLIVFVAYKIFASGGDSASSGKQTPNTVQKQTGQTPKKNDTKAASEKKSQGTDKAGQDSSQSQSSSQSQDNGQNNDTMQNNDQQSAATTSPGQADASQAVVTNGGSTSNVVRTIENPAWKPVGTSQTGPHTPVYDTSSVDWQEMLNAISYATGMEQSNMIVQFLGRDKSTSNASVGTVYSKDKQQKYKVYIKWVDGAGWQPTKVEELNQIQ